MVMVNRNKIILLVGSLSLVMLMAAVWLLFKRGPQPVQSISPTGGVAEARYHFSESPIFLQTDSRWASDEIGGSREPLSAVGCTICSLSMALAHYGLEMTPDQLNERLKIKEGFTAQGWLKWDSVTEVTEQKIRIDIPAKLSHETIDQALKANQPVLAKILLGGRIQHWVLIVGKSGQEYLIKDPLGDGKSLDTLSKYGSNIFAIRIVTSARV
jgi:hypothetical protein